MSQSQPDGNSELPSPFPPPVSDPCAGRKGTLNHSDGSDRTDKKGIGHISPRHINQIPKHLPGGTDPKSYYSFGTFFTKGSATYTDAQREAAVMAVNQETFMKGGVVRLGAGKVVYVYAPLVSVTVGDAGIEGDVVGFDRNHDFAATNVRTVVVVVADCRTVITSFPGLPAGVQASDPGIVGTPKWWKPDYTLPF